MTYRLMGEWATDLVCKKLGVDKKCVTAVTPLPGSETGSLEEVSKKFWTNPTTAQKATVGRLGDQASKVSFSDLYDQSLVCECEEVSAGEVNRAIDKLDVHNLVDLRRRTRVGMGTCQGELCACRSAGLLAKAHNCTDKAKSDLDKFMNERWKGMYPIAWGETLRESAYTQWVYSGVFGMDEK
jgi:glycerol-3-phosphate dehydrogenase